jgi:hypothetical protein
MKDLDDRLSLRKSFTFLEEEGIINHSCHVTDQLMKFGSCFKIFSLKPDVVVHTCNPSTQETEARRLRVQSQPGLPSKTHVSTLPLPK